MSAEIRLDGARLVIRGTSYDDRSRTARVPSAKWDRSKRIWTYAATPTVAAQLAREFKDATIDDGTKRLIEIWKDVLINRQLLDSKAPFTDEIPGERIPLREHQRLAIRWAIASRACYLDHDMGTGKTATSIGIASVLRAKLTLVCCPNMVVDVWPEQIAKHSTLPFEVANLGPMVGSVPKKRIIAEDVINRATARARPVFIVINHESIWRKAFGDWARKIPWDLLVVDECFPAGTEILTPTGSVPIELLREGDEVIGASLFDGQLVTTTVNATFVNKTRVPFVSVCGVKMTSNHPVWTTDRYKRADEIEDGDQVCVLRGVHEKNIYDNLRMVRGSEREQNIGDRARYGQCNVYNFETGTGNYFAGGLLVHNCHKSKAAGGKLSKWLAGIAPGIPYKVALSGTPMPKDPLDLYAQLRWLEPGIFGTNYTSFKTKYSISGGYGGYETIGWQNQEEFSKRWAFIKHTIKTDEVLELPDTQHITIKVTLDDAERALYDDLEKDFVADIANGTITTANVLTRALRLSQVVNGHVKTDDGVVTTVGNSKARALQDLLDGAPMDEPIVVFTRFVHDVDAVRAVAENLDRPVFEVTGRLKQLVEWKRSAADGNGPILVANIQSGKEGIDLTQAASYIVYFSKGYSLGDYEQTLKRSHRDGQTRKVIYYHLDGRGTIDVRISASLREKRNVIDDMLRGGK